MRIPHFVVLVLLLPFRAAGTDCVGGRWDTWPPLVSARQGAAVGRIRHESAVLPLFTRILVFAGADAGGTAPTDVFEVYTPAEYLAASTRTFGSLKSRYR